MTTYPLAVRSVKVDGVTISFQEAGPTGGPAVVLLHGGASSAATWHRLGAALAEAGHHVIAADLRGHGGSSRTVDYPLSGFSDDIRGLLDALDITSTMLVGHSLGGYVAAALAQRQPARITRLVLEEPGLPARDSISRGPSGPKFLLPALVGLAVRRGCDRAAVISAVRQLRVPDPDWWDRLSSITADTLLVIGGPASHIPRQRLVEAAGSIRGARLVTVPVGHRVHSRGPEQFLAEVVPFLTRRPRLSGCAGA
jgi:pimeloyl-ACP methyl ester carboxylesterase